MGCLGDRYIRYQNCFARLVLDIRLIALVAMPVLGNISTEFQLKRNAGVIYHAPVKCVVVMDDSVQRPTHEGFKTKNLCMYSRLGFSYTRSN